ncbi:hypothetical protein FRC12_023197 [Ceratobasidium sp. 428]|nr:hypothetical protein FRC12_023197 [Ceratobasidium sp. 428]
MVRFIALVLAASGLVAAAVPGPRTYTISQNDKSLTLKKSEGFALLTPSNATEPAQQWVLEYTPGSPSRTFTFKNAKFGTYFSYWNVPLRGGPGEGPMAGNDRPVPFILAPSNKPGEFYITNKENMTVIYYPIGGSPNNLADRPQVHIHWPQEGSEQTWVFKKAPAAAAAAKPLNRWL